MNLMFHLSASTGMATDEYSLPEQAPGNFAALPELYLEDVLDLLLYFVRFVVYSTDKCANM